MRAKLLCAALALAAGIAAPWHSRVVAVSAAESAAPPAAVPAPLAVIVNRTNPVNDLTLKQLRHLFLGGRTTWDNGRRVTIALREPGQAERLSALRVIYGMSEADLTRHFLRQTFTGDPANPPRTLSTGVGVKRFVFNVPGAIGVVAISDVDDSIKQLRINGLAPGEPGYPLVIAEP